MGVRDRVWTRERARREGVSLRRLTGGAEFVRVVPGAYVEACWADDLATRCAAVVHRLPGATLSHWTALALHGLPVPDLGGPIEVTVAPDGRLPRWSGVLVHRSFAIHPFTLDELPVTGAVRAWVDAAASVQAGPARPDLADLVAAGDALLRRRPGTRTDVGNLLTLRPGLRGAVAVTRALPLLDGRAESPMESRLRVVLTAEGLAPPAVQHVVTDSTGAFVARVDLAYPEQRVVVEYDGDHHRDPAQWRRDLRRRERVEALGWVVLVVTAADLLAAPAEVAARVRRALARRAPRRPPSAR